MDPEAKKIYLFKDGRGYWHWCPYSMKGNSTFRTVPHQTRDFALAACRQFYRGQNFKLIFALS